MNILQQLIAHKAAVALTGAAVGVVLTAVFATKEAREHDAAILEAENDKDNALTNPEMVEMMEKQGFSEEEVEEFKQYELVPDDFEYLSRKEKAIIFAKTHWKTGLTMAVTFGLMIFSHVSMVKELAAVGAAFGLVSAKYKDLDEYLKKNYPDQYNEIKRILNRKNARKKISEKGLKNEESYDGRKRYYFPLSDQIVFMKPEDFVKVQSFMSATMGTSMRVTLNEILDYIHYDLGYKDVHISDIDYVWEFPADESVDYTSFPSIEFEYDDVLDDETMIVCQVVKTSIDPEFRYAAEVKRA